MKVTRETWQMLFWIIAYIIIIITYIVLLYSFNIIPEWIIDILSVIGTIETTTGIFIVGLILRDARK